MTGRDWTEREARAWLKASFPNGLAPRVRITAPKGPDDSPYGWMVRAVFESATTYSRGNTLRDVCLRVVDEARREGISVNQVEEP